jgi:Flp pilus assembly secretin CpaC
MRHAACLLVALVIGPSLAWSDGPVSTEPPATQEIRGPLLPDVAEESRPVVRLASAVEPLAPRPVNAGVQWTEAQALLAQKVAQLELLQADIDALRKTTGTPQQFVIHVELLEVSHTKMRKLGFDFAKFQPDGIGIPETIDSFSQGGIQSLGSGEDARTFITALKQNNIGKVLASPTLVTTSGRPTSFLVGGELPVPAAPGSDSAVEFKEFGTRVDVRVQPLGNDRVELEVSPRVSEIDEAHVIEVNGQRVPSLRVRQINTACEMQLGETVAFGGPSTHRIEARKHAFSRIEEVDNEIGLWLVVRVEAAESMDPTLR